MTIRLIVEVEVEVESGPMPCARAIPYISYSDSPTNDKLVADSDIFRQSLGEVHMV